MALGKSVLIDLRDDVSDDDSERCRDPMAELGAGPRLMFDLTTDDEGLPVLKLLGELDITNVRSVDELVQPVIRTSADRLVIDASGLQFVDSSGIALWVRWANVIRHLEIREPSSVLRRMLQRMGLTERLRVTP
jgi:anti-anti-sigma factor